MSDIFQDPRLIDFSQYIDTKRQPNGAILKSSIELMDIYKLAPFMVILDIEEGPRFKFRYVGTAIATAHGLDGTGKYYDEIDFGPSSQNFLTVYQDCAEHKKAQWSFNVVEVDAEKIYPFRLIHYSFERLCYPLEDEHGNVLQILSLLSLKKNAATAVSFEHKELD